jgi:hypothetical protein
MPKQSRQRIYTVPGLLPLLLILAGMILLWQVLFWLGISHAVDAHTCIFLSTGVTSIHAANHSDHDDAVAALPR